MKKTFLVIVLLLLIVELVSSCKVRSNSYHNYREHPKYRIY